MNYRRPESVLVLVYVPGAKVLLLKRVSPFSFWQSVTGSLRRDELPGAAALRELCEETGIANGPVEDTGRSAVFTIDKRWRHRYAPGTLANREYEFRVPLAEEKTIRLDTVEHTDFAWVDIDTAIDRVWSWTNKAALTRLRREW